MQNVSLESPSDSDSERMKKPVIKLEGERRERFENSVGEALKTAAHDSRDAADHVLTRLEEAFSNLSEQPSRGAYPKELLELGLREFREIFFKPYRIIYQLQDDIVYVVAVADGRRDVRSLLERRLLRV